MATRDQVLQEVVTERIRQDRKWGANRNHLPQEWLMILGEEVGEANNAALEAHFCSSEKPGVKHNELTHLRTELIQVAAVAVAFVESLDRNELRGWVSDE